MYRIYTHKLHIYPLCYIDILGVCPKRLPLQELTNELQNREIDYGNQNKRQKLVEILDEELTRETLEKEGNHILFFVKFSTRTIIINFLTF